MKGLDPAFYQHQVYSSRADHFTHLQLCLEKCQLGRLSLDLAKCAFGVKSGTPLVDSASHEGIVVDLHKVKVLIEAPPPTNAKALSQFHGQIRWQSRMIR